MTSMPEYPRWLEWELLSGPVKFDVMNRGAFPEWVKELEVCRDENFGLAVVGTGVPPGTGIADYFHQREESTLRPGELVPEPPLVSGTTGVANCELHKAYLGGSSLRYIGGPSTQYANAAELCVTYSHDPVAWHTEWVVNLNLPSNLCTRGTAREWQSTYTRRRIPDDDIPSFPTSTSGASKDARDHFAATIAQGDTNTIGRVGKVPNVVAPAWMQPGFIEWRSLDGKPVSEDFRRKLLAALSFCLGREVSSIGFSEFSADWRRIRSGATALSRQGNNVSFDNPCCLPFDILAADGFLDEERASTCVTRFLRATELFDIENPLWLYHVGRASPSEAAAAHYGAALEALRETYVKGQKLETTHLPRDLWDRVRVALQEAFEAAIRGVEIDSKAVDHIRKNAIPGLNSKSSNWKYPEFFERLGMGTGNVEKAALGRRNKAAHGAGMQKPDYRVLTNMNNAMQTLFHRTMMRVIGLEYDYVDYSSYGFPHRNIGEPLGGPEGDGKPIS